jgi:hypothetical protein
MFISVYFCHYAGMMAMTLFMLAQWQAGMKSKSSILMA